MSRVVIIFVIIFFLSPIGALDAKKPSVIVVPLVKLLVDPHLYDGANVEVMGYIDGGIYLYLTKDHADNFDYLSSIIISDTDNGDIILSDCLPGYVKIRGLFARTKDYNYIIKDVTGLYKPGFGPCWVKPDDE